jgi:hypothetical protein
MVLTRTLGSTRKQPTLAYPAAPQDPQATDPTSAGYTGGASRQVTSPIRNVSSPTSAPVRTGAADNSGWGYYNPAPAGGGAAIDWKSILDGVGGGGTGSTPGFEQTVAPNPDIDFAIKEMQQRYKGDMGAGRAIDLVGGKLREAQVGAGKNLAANLARRGVSGTGLSGNAYAGLEADTQRNISGSAANIAQDAESRRDQILNSIVGAGGAKDGVAAGQANLAFNTWNAQQENARANQAAQLQRTLALLNLVGGIGGGGGSSFF